MTLVQTVQAGEKDLQRKTSHSSSTDESKEVEMVVFAEHKGAESSLTSEGDVVDEGFGPLFEMTGACGEKGKVYSLPTGTVAIDNVAALNSQIKADSYLMLLLVPTY